MVQAIPYKLKYLRIKNPSRSTAKTYSAASQTPNSFCEAKLNDLLTCWRLHGVDNASCITHVSELQDCMNNVVVTRRFNL